MSATCTTLPSSTARPTTVSRPGTILRWRWTAQYSGSVLAEEDDTRRYASPSRMKTVVESAPQSRKAVSVTVSSTACTSEVERLMTLSTSLVAVWYWSDSSSSSAFSKLTLQIGYELLGI